MASAVVTLPAKVEKKMSSNGMRSAEVEKKTSSNGMRSAEVEKKTSSNEMRSTEMPEVGKMISTIAVPSTEVAEVEKMMSSLAMPSTEVEKKKSSNVVERGKFMKVYQQLKKELLSDSELVTYTDESRAWVEEVDNLPELRSV